MKKLAILIMAFGLSFTGLTQAPQAFAFQSTITHADGSPFINTDVSLLFNIRSVSGTGTIVYAESHSNVTTSSTGYFTASVGQGVPTLGSFSAINWNGSSYYLELLVDTLSGTGTNYVSLGASQLLSVPYALHAGNGGGFTPVVFQCVLLDYMTTGAEVIILTSGIEIDMDANNVPMYSGSTLTVPVTGIYRVKYWYNGLAANTTKWHLNGTPMWTGGYSVDPDRLVQLTAGDVLTIETGEAGTHDVTFSLTQIR